MRYADSYADCCPPDSSRKDAREDAVDAECGRIYNDKERAIRIVAAAAPWFVEDFMGEESTPVEMLASVLLTLRGCYRVIHGYDESDKGRVMDRLKLLTNSALEMVEKAVSDAAELEVE